ncbi:hypothetical protein [Nocardia araoensis]|uniref:hypothetical protein n=1 Tax=Nocardia araoensis TaxID=228600 RepID=UPI0002F9826F|nr:hypothetical protein [Nocardia araoensis]
MEQDADLAQARVFLELLTRRAQTLARDMESAHRRDPAARHELYSELCVVRRYIERLHRRFPETAGPQAHRQLAAVPATQRTLG